MKNGSIKKIIPHIIAVVVFLLVAVLYCQPVLEGKVVYQHDLLGWKGMAQQSFEYKEKYGHYPLWTNSMFGGMPAYTIAMEATFPLPLSFLYNLLTLWLPKPIGFFFMACICFYFLCRVLRIHPWISILAALVFAYSTYDPVIVAVGHDTKIQAIALMPGVIGSLLLLLQRNYWWGTALLALFFSFQVGTQHLQIIYYTGIVTGFIILAYLVHAGKNNLLKPAFLSLGLAVIAFLTGFLTFAVTMLPLREYAKETMRGGRSELTAEEGAGNKTKGGLDKDYAFGWSYGVAETFTFVVPGMYGGSNGAGKEFSGSTKFTDKLSEIGVPEDQALQMENQSSYWGDQPGTSGPVYLGAVVCFLFILGMVYLDSWHKWWIIAATVFAILLAWGKNFSAFNYFLFDYLPFYNKFRAPSMSLVIPQLTFALTGALALNQLLAENTNKETLWKKFRLSLYITGGVVLILAGLYFGSDYKGANDKQLYDYFVSALSQPQQGQQPTPEMQVQARTMSQSLLTALRDDRQSKFGGDLLRSLLFIGLTALLIGAYLRNKLQAKVVMIGVLLLGAIDVLGVGRRYLNADSFVEPEQMEATFIPTEADKQIMADPAKPFRVFDQTDGQGPFNSSRASYFHNSIGGYHPAKLGLYQDLIERQIGKGNMQVFNMLNTRYFIVQNPQNGQPQAQLNPDAFGPVWLVKGIRTVPTPDAEMNALSTANLKDTAIIQQKFAGNVKTNAAFDTTARIQVVKYANDTVTYNFSGSKDAFAVFSEIYYPLGWNVSIDGKKADYVKTNYLLRGMTIPAGNHTIEFVFEPETFKTGNTVTLITNILVYLLLAAAIVMEIRKNKQRVPVS